MTGGLFLPKNESDKQVFLHVEKEESRKNFAYPKKFFYFGIWQWTIDN